MGAALTTLHALVRSLTKHEKIYFRTWVGRREGEKDYLILFDHLLGQEEVSAASLQARFSDRSLGRRLAAVQHYLFNKLLECLAAYERGKTGSGKIRERMDAALVLHGKGLIDAAWKKLQKARKLAAERFDHQLQLEIIRIERDLFGRYRIRGPEQLRQLYEEEEQVLENLRCTNLYWLHSAECNDRVTVNGQWISPETVDYLRDLLELEELKKVERAIHPLAQARFHNIHALVGREFGEVERFLGASRKVVEVFQENVAFASQHLFLYVIALDYMVLALLVNRQWGQAEQVIGEMEGLTQLDAFPKSSDSKYLNVQFRILGRRFVFHKGRGDRLACDQLLPEIAPFLGEKAGQIELSGQLELHFHVAGFFLDGGQHREALTWIQRTLEVAGDYGREDIIGYSLLLRVLVHYELGNWELLESMLKGCKRYFLVRKRDYTWIRVMLSLLRDLLDQSPQVDLGMRLQDAIQDLRECRQTYPNNRPFELYDYQAWVERQAER